MAPMLGGVIAVPIYWFMIEVNHPPTDEKEEKEEEEERKNEKQESHQLKDV